MDFGEVGNHLDSLIERESQVSPVEPVISTTYDSLIHQPVVRKPTFSNFVHRLKQHSSKTRFVREYKKMAHTGSDGIASDDDMYSAEDNASIRIIDPSRSLAREEEEEEEIIGNLGIRTRDKHPIKRVKINESANEIRGGMKLDTDTIASFEIPRGDLTSTERFVTFDVAIGLIQKDISDKTDDIYKQIKRIEINKDEITRYKHDLLNMQKQLDFFHYSLTLLKTDLVPDMLQHEIKANENKNTLLDHRKQNMLLKSRFEKYRKAISIDTRLSELETKIKAAWKRDEIWATIRDKGFPFLFAITLFIAIILNYIMK